MKNISLLTLTLLLVGCFSTNAPNDGKDRYRIASIGNAERSIPAEVISTRRVTIKELNSGAYAQAGGWLGAPWLLKIQITLQLLLLE